MHVHIYDFSNKKRFSPKSKVDDILPTYGHMQAAIIKPYHSWSHGIREWTFPVEWDFSITVYVVYMYLHRHTARTVFTYKETTASYTANVYNYQYINL